MFVFSSAHTQYRKSHVNEAVNEVDTSSRSKCHLCPSCSAKPVCKWQESCQKQTNDLLHGKACAINKYRIATVTPVAVAYCQSASLTTRNHAVSAICKLAGTALKQRWLTTPRCWSSATCNVSAAHKWHLDHHGQTSELDVP